MMMRKPWILIAVALLLATGLRAGDGAKQIPVSAGGKLVLDLEAGGEAMITGGGSAVAVRWKSNCSPDCEVTVDESGGDVTVRTRFLERGKHQNSSIDLVIQVPARFDVEIDSLGGGLSISGVDGTFKGKTNGGELKLHDVHGVAELSTLGGEISLTDSDIDGYLKTNGGEVLFANVVGDIKGSSMGGNVRYKNVKRRDGRSEAPPHIDQDADDVDPETVQISTMGGAIDVDDAPEGADLHTMGGNISVKDANRFVRAKTMGGDIDIDAIDGWVKAITMGGDIDVALSGAGGDVELTSMSGDVTLVVPAGMGLDVDLQLAFTRNSSQKFRVETPGNLPSATSPEWDYGQGSPRKYVTTKGAVNGGGHKVKIRTINGNIVIDDGERSGAR